MFKTIEYESIKTRKQIAMSEYNQNTRSKITIVRDSILNGISKFGMKRKHNVKVKPHAGASIQDIKLRTRPFIRQKQDSIIIHAGTSQAT